MKRILTIVLASFMGISAFTSCEEKKEPIDVTKNAFLMDRAWKLTAVNHTTNVDAEIPTWTNLFIDWEPCKKDDFYFFNTKNTGSKNDYFVKCNVSDPDHIDFFYTITENDNNITIYTNPDDMGGSAILFGKMETPNINEFKIINRFYNGATELTESIEYLFELTFPTDL